MLSLRHQPWHTVRSIINTLEDPSIPLINFFFSFFSILALRYFSEGFSESYYYLNVASLDYLLGFLHTILFYISLALGLVSILHFATGENLNKTIRFVLTGFTIILMTPFLDLLIHPHNADNMYLHPGMHINLLFSYLTLFGGFSGITLGLRTEIFTIFFGFLLYLRVKQIGWIKSFLYAWLCYTLIFIVASSPIALQAFFNLIERKYIYDNGIMYVFFLTLSLMFSLIIYIRHVSTTFRSNTLYLYRFVSHGFFVIAGGFIAFFSVHNNNQDYWSTHIIIHIIFALFSFTLLTFSGIGFSNWQRNTQDMMAITLAITLITIMNIDILFFFIFFLLISCIYSLVAANNKNIILLQLITTCKSLMLVMIGYTLLASGG